MGHYSLAHEIFARSDYARRRILSSKRFLGFASPICKNPAIIEKMLFTELLLDPHLEAVRALADLCHLDRVPLATSLLRVFRCVV